MDKVKVRIQATQIVSFDKEVKLSLEDYDALMEVYNSANDRKLAEHLEGWFDDLDAVDWQPFEDVDIELLSTLAAEGKSDE